MRSSKSSKIRFRKSTDLATHPFGTLVLYNALHHPSRKAFERIRLIARVAAELESMPESPEELSDRFETLPLVEKTAEEKYPNDVAKYYLALANHIDRLESIQIYLSFTNSLSQKLENNQITTEEWLQYHFSNHILTIVSIYDTSLCLFNSVAQLNVSQNLRFENNIRSKIKGNKDYEGIKLSLDKIKNKVSQYRAPRNSFAHGGQNPHHDEIQVINLMDTYNMWRQYFKLEDKATTQRRKTEMNWLSITALREELAKETEEICQLVLKFFSALQPIYEQNISNQKKI